MSATLSPLVQKNDLKEYLIFRVDEDDDHCELADESALEGAAAHYADLMDDAQPEHGIHYEVRRADSSELLHSTADPEDRARGVPWIQTAT